MKEYYIKNNSHIVFLKRKIMLTIEKMYVNMLGALLCDNRKNIS